MGKKRVSYQNLLKTAISEFDTSKTVDVKGPMLDPIISWDGDGELPVYKDAASVLERYYFNEGRDRGVEVSEAEYNEDGTEKKSKSEEHSEGPGTEQAGTSDDATISGSKKDAAKDIAKEAEYNNKDVPKGKEYTEEQENGDMDEEEGEEEEMEESEDVENAVIEKLIAEMEEVSEQDEGEEDDEDEDEGEEEEMEEGKDMSYEGDGVKPGMSAKDEKESKDPEEHTTGAGTEQAGTGDDEGQIPDRKDVHDKFVKAKQYTDELAKLFEQDDEEMDEKGDEEEEELDVDKEVKEQASGAGHVPPPSLQRKMKTGDQSEEEYEEAFQIFKEAIEDEDEEEEEESEE